MDDLSAEIGSGSTPQNDGDRHSRQNAVRDDLAQQPAGRVADHRRLLGQPADHLRRVTGHLSERLLGEDVGVGPGLLDGLWVVRSRRGNRRVPGLVEQRCPAGPAARKQPEPVDEYDRCPPARVRPLDSCDPLRDGGHGKLLAGRRLRAEGQYGGGVASGHPDQRLVLNRNARSSAAIPSARLPRPDRAIADSRSVPKAPPTRPITCDTSKTARPRARSTTSPATSVHPPRPVAVRMQLLGEVEVIQVDGPQAPVVARLEPDTRDAVRAAERPEGKCYATRSRKSSYKVTRPSSSKWISARKSPPPEMNSTRSSVRGT
jgi:hypothetical protein